MSYTDLQDLISRLRASIAGKESFEEATVFVANIGAAIDLLEAVAVVQTRNEMRPAFEEWLQREHMLDSEWDDVRNCFKDFPAYLAHKAFQAGAQWQASLAPVMQACLPEGWQLVPIEPTPAMCRALFVNLCNADNEAKVIRAIFAAAQSAPQAVAVPDRDAVLEEALIECEAIRESGCEARAGAIECCEAISQLRALKQAPQPIAALADMVSVARKDGSDYCKILSILGMEEDGDPVAEVSRLLDASQRPVPALSGIEQYRMQMACICTAACGGWKIGDSVHIDYDTLALRDVARLYEKYAELYDAAQLVQQRVTLSDDANQIADIILSDPDGGTMVISGPLMYEGDGSMRFTVTNPKTGRRFGVYLGLAELVAQEAK